MLVAGNSDPLFKALAGIMGGENSGVSEQTRSIFLESAYFAQETIAGKAVAEEVVSMSKRFTRSP